MEPFEATAPTKTPEQQVADLLPIEADPAEARRVLEEVPFWFHTFALNRAEGIYAQGSAVDHRYHLPAIPEDFSGTRVLDVGTFDGFYAFLAEARGADRVVAIDNEQYVHWVKSRWGIELNGSEGFGAIHRLLNSKVEYRKLDAFDLDQLNEQFDLIFCFGILHRVYNPLGLLRGLRDRLDSDGRLLVETHGVPNDEGSEHGAVRVPKAGEVYKHDAYVFWEFTTGSLERLARYAGYRKMELNDAPVIDGHPRVLATLTADRDG